MATRIGVRTVIDASQSGERRRRGATKRATGAARIAALGVAAGALAPTAAGPQPGPELGVSPEMFDWSGAWVGPIVVVSLSLVLGLLACLLVGLVHWFQARAASSPGRGRYGRRAPRTSWR